MLQFAAPHYQLSIYQLSIKNYPFINYQLKDFPLIKLPYHPVINLLKNYFRL